MFKNSRRQMALLLVLAMVLTSLAGWQSGTVDAAKKAAFSSKKITLTVGRSKKLTVKNAKGKKLTWKIKNKKIAKMTKSGKYGKKVKALKKGSTTITCKVKAGKKSYTLKCKVKVNAKKKATPAPAVTPAPVVPTTAPTVTPTATPYPPMTPIKEAYANVIPVVGNCLSLNQLKDEKLLAAFKTHFNSFTLENEMKPEAILKNDTLVNTSEAKTMTGTYVVPDSYEESTVPHLNFETIDQVLKIAYDNGIKMRAHTLVWHSQTPEWFFRTGYQGSGKVVSTTVMDARMEMYIKSVMYHVYQLDDGKYKDTVYAWDVVNEYMHNGSGNWSSVYGSRNVLGTKPGYVKTAFQIADSVLQDLGIRDKVSLIFNDFNTYVDPQSETDIINFINEGEETKICNGIGMQSHLDVDYPSPEEFIAAVDIFKANNFEIQITEFDATINNKEGRYNFERQKEADQGVYVDALMKAIVAAKRGGANITGFTIWGMYDTISWRKESKPLLFKSYDATTGVLTPKISFYNFINAAK